MSIVSQDIRDEMASALDAEGSDYYRDDVDYIPSINFSIDRIVEFIDKHMGSNKFSEEAVLELTKVLVFQTSAYSRISRPATVWTAVSLYWDIVTLPANPTLTAGANEKSFLRSDITFLSGTKTGQVMTGKRLNSDEYSDNQLNPFGPGFNLENRNIISPSLREAADYTGAYSLPAADKFEFEVSPDKPKDFVAIDCILNPVHVTALTDSVQFPARMKNVIVELALYFIAKKQGDKTNIHGLALEDITLMMQNYE